MDIFDEIENVFKGMGYQVATQPQEKPDPKQVSVELDTVKLAVETPITYRMTTNVTIFFMAKNGKDVLEKIKKFMKAIEPRVKSYAISFKFKDPEFLIEGRSFYVALPCEYVEVIQIE